MNTSDKRIYRYRKECPKEWQGTVQRLHTPSAWPLALFWEGERDPPFPLTPRINFTFDPIHGWKGNRAYRPLKSAVNEEELSEHIHRLLEVDFDHRRQLYESIDLFRFTHRDCTIDLSDLLQEPASLPEDLFNYAALWAIQNKRCPHLDRLLAALEQESLTSSYARKMAITFVGKTPHDRTAHTLARLMRRDPAEENRASAAYALARIALSRGSEFVKGGMHQ